MTTKNIKLKPKINDIISSLLSHDMKFNNFLVEWDEVKKHYNAKIIDEEFEDWKLFYPKKIKILEKKADRETVMQWVCRVVIKKFHTTNYIYDKIIQNKRIRQWNNLILLLMIW